MRWSRLVGMAVGGAAATYVGISALMARGLTRTERRPIHDDPSTVGLDFADIAFRSVEDRLSLSGWLIRAPGLRTTDERWVIMVHGHSAHRADPETGSLALARDLVGAGFSVFMFDLRGCGASRARPASAGYHEQRDLMGAIQYLSAMGVPPERIAILGFSLGAAVALLICARQERVAAVISDSSFADLDLRVSQSMTGNISVLRFFMPGMRVMARLLFGIDMRAVSPMRAISHSSVPVLLIHGDQDRIVPMIHFRLLSRAVAAGSGETWLVEGAGHAQSYRHAPAEYRDRAIAFLDRWLSAAGTGREAGSTGG